MAIEILPKADLHEFHKSLLKDIRKIFKDKTKQSKERLESKEVRKLLNISPGTLQNLRINGTLSYTKITGIIYYANQDIDNLLENNKVNRTSTLF
jgi:hypothetical protein